MILTATVHVVVLVGTRRAGSQALAAVSAQQGQLGATGLAVPPAGAGGAGWLAGCRGGRGEGESDCQSHQKSIFSSYQSFLHGYRTACHCLANNIQTCQWFKCLVMLTGIFLDYGGKLKVPHLGCVCRNIQKRGQTKCCVGACKEISKCLHKVWKWIYRSWS